MPLRPWFVFRHVEIEDLGLIAPVMSECGIPTRYVDLFRGDPVPERLDGVGGIILMGGPMGVYDEDRYRYLVPENRLIQKALDAGLPMLGVCLGSQLIAKAAAARVYKGPRREIGWRPIRLTAEGEKDPVIGTLTNTPLVFHWHGDTFDLPAGAIHLASSDRYPHQAFRIGRDVYALQFHLEVDPGMIDRWLDSPDNIRELHDVSDETSAEAIRREASEQMARLTEGGRSFFKAYFRQALVRD